MTAGLGGSLLGNASRVSRSGRGQQGLNWIVAQNGNQKELVKQIR